MRGICNIHSHTLTITSLFPNAYKLSNAYIYQIILFRHSPSLDTCHLCILIGLPFLFDLFLFFFVFCLLDSIGWKKFQWNVNIKGWETRALWNAIKSKLKNGENAKVANKMKNLFHYEYNIYRMYRGRPFRFNLMEKIPSSLSAAATVQQWQPLCTPNCKCTLFDIYLQFVYKLYQLHRVAHRNFIGKWFALSSTTIKWMHAFEYILMKVNFLKAFCCYTEAHSNQPIPKQLYASMLYWLLVHFLSLCNLWWI